MAHRCDEGLLPTASLRVGQRTIDFYARTSLVPARREAPPFPVSLAGDARGPADFGIRLGGVFGGSTVGYHRFADAQRCGVAVIRLIRSPIARSEVQALGTITAILAGISATLGSYLIVARPMLRRVAATASAAGRVGSARFKTVNEDDWSDLASIDQSLSKAHERIIANERQLASRATEIEQLLNAIAHDLKTPMAIIQLILQQMPHNAEATPEIGRALAEVQHANALLENLELGAQMREGDLAVALNPVDLTAIVADSAGRFALLGESLGMIVNASWPDMSLWAQGDAVLLNRIISNLVHNALRHSGGRHVALWIVGDAGQAHLRIIDDGVGLPSAAQRTLLTAASGDFGDQFVTITHQGRGLQIVRQLCALLEIEIELETPSTSGTAILLKIPLIR